MTFDRFISDRRAEELGSAVATGAQETVTRKLIGAGGVVQEGFIKIAEDVITKLTKEFTQRTGKTVNTPDETRDRIYNIIFDALGRNAVSDASDTTRNLYSEEIFKVILIYSLTVECLGRRGYSPYLRLKENLAGLDKNLNISISAVREKFVTERRLEAALLKEEWTTNTTPPLVYAVLKGYEKEVAKLLVGTEYKVDSITILEGRRDGWPLLCSVVWDNRVDIARLLLDYRENQANRIPLNDIKMPTTSSWANYNLLACALAWDYDYKERTSVGFFGDNISMPLPSLPFVGNVWPKKSVSRDVTEMEALLRRYGATPLADIDAPRPAQRMRIGGHDE